jgi:Zn-dependent protease with chaperone function
MNPNKVSREANKVEVDMKTIRNLSSAAIVLVLSLALGAPIQVLAQTRVVPPKNPYPIAKDVELGRKAAQQVERQLPRLSDRDVQDYVERIGDRLAESIPAEYQHPEFRYTYTVVNVRDVNAFALPGGFTFVNRGLIETAQNEAQLAGVIAHEISHVALRHGTAQAAKAQKYQYGSIAGQILGAVIGGGMGQAVGGLSQVGVGVAFLRYGREYERQADILGAQIMANAGYDPRELANMFRILERQGGGAGPEFLSDHPNPGNRFDAINREAQLLRVTNPVRRTNDFSNAQAILRDMPRARSMQEISRSGSRYPQNTRYPDDRYPNDRYPNDRNPNDRYPDDRYPNDRNPNDRYPNDRYPNDDARPQLGRVESPSSSYRTYSSGNLFRISVPDNWREMGSGNEITFAPEGAYADYRGQFVFTHGVQVGVSNSGTRNLRQATDQLISSLVQGNNNLRQTGSYRRESVGGHEGLSITLSNVSEATGRNEVINLVTAMLGNGEVFYLVAVAPESEYSSYQRTFQNIMRTVELNR